MKLFHIQVLHLWVHVVVNVCGRSKLLPSLRTCVAPPLAQFARGENGDGFGWPHAVILREVENGHLAKGVQVVVTIV